MTVDVKLVAEEATICTKASDFLEAFRETKGEAGTEGQPAEAGGAVSRAGPDRQAVQRLEEGREGSTDSGAQREKIAPAVKTKSVFDQKPK